jgi:hypothetical protein
MAIKRSRVRRLIQRLSPVLATTLAALCSLPLSALEDLDSASLQQACSQVVAEEDDASAQACASYLLGFLAATDGVILSGERSSSFLVRALKTRGSRLSEASERELVGKYCFAPEASLTELASRIVDMPAGDLPLTASDLVTQVLERHYRCSGGQ